MALLSKGEILAADDLPWEDVPVPEWGGEVRVRGLNGSQRSLIEATMVAAKGQTVEIRVEAFKTLRERLIATCLIDGEGRRLFGDGEVAALGQKSGRVLDNLFKTASRLSGMDAGQVAEIAGESEAGPSAGSDSDSPSTSEEASPRSTGSAD